MRVYKTKNVKKDIVASVYCDICKQPIDKAFVDYNGWVQLKTSAGYPSQYDGQEYELDMCDGCFEIFKKNVPLRLTRNEFEGKKE